MIDHDGRLMSHEELPTEAVERILRRASELSDDADVADVGAAGIDPAALLEAAREVGMSVAAVERSIAIERLGPIPDPSLLDRILGRSVVAVDRVVVGDVDATLSRIDRWLTTGHHLRLDRHRNEEAEWSKRGDVVAAAQRVVRGFSGEGQLGDARRVRAAAVRVDDSSTMIRIAVDRSLDRGLRTGAASVCAIAGVASGVAGVVVAAPIALAVVPAAAVSVAVVGSGRGHARKMERELDRLLDAVEDEREPERLASGLTAGIRRRISKKA